MPPAASIPGVLASPSVAGGLIITGAADAVQSGRNEFITSVHAMYLSGTLTILPDMSHFALLQRPAVFLPGHGENFLETPSHKPLSP